MLHCNIASILLLEPTNMNGNAYIQSAINRIQMLTEEIKINYTAFHASGRSMTLYKGPDMNCRVFIFSWYVHCTQVISIILSNSALESEEENYSKY